MSLYPVKVEKIEKKTLPTKKTNQARSFRITPHSSQTRPRRGKCPACRAEILTGLYDAVPRYWDTAHLTSLGELTAHLNGLKTWLVCEKTTHRRTARSIAFNPDGLCGVILRDHCCLVEPPAGACVKPPTPPLPPEPNF